MFVVALLSVVAAASAPLTLDEAWAVARERSPRLRAAGADVDVAAAEADIAGRWLPDPTLQLSGSTDALTSQEGELDLDASLQQVVRWPMETWASQAGARALVDAATHDQARAAVAAWRDVAVAFSALAAALDERAVQQGVQAIAARVNTAALERVRMGQSAAIEASFAAVDLAAATSATALAESAVAAARASLCRELAQDECADVDVVWPLLPVPALTDDQLLAVIEARPDVAAAQKRASNARALREAAGWRRVPAPTLGLMATQERSVIDGADGALNDDDTLLGLRVSVPLPVFSFGAGTTAVADAQQRRSEAERDDMRLRALHQTRAALQTWRASVSARDAWQGVEPRFDESLRWLADGYLGGVVDLDALLTGRDRIARARLAAIGARRAEVIAAADALLALGTIPSGATP